MKMLVFKAWWGCGHDDEIKQGFTRATADTLNSLRIGRLGLVFGVDDS